MNLYFSNTKISKRNMRHYLHLLPTSQIFCKWYLNKYFSTWTLQSLRNEKIVNSYRTAPLPEEVGAYLSRTLL